MSDNHFPEVAALYALGRQQRDIYFAQEVSKAETDPSYRPYFEANILPVMQAEHAKDQRARRIIKIFIGVVVVGFVVVLLAVAGLGGLFVYGATHTTP